MYPGTKATLRGPRAELPLVTVIMPIRNEACYIRRSLGAVLAQDYPTDRLEVIVADGQSNDDTRSIIQELQKSYPNLYLVDNPGFVASCGLNAGITRATGDVVIIVSGHCEIASDYVTRCVEHLILWEVDAVGGRTDTIGETYQAQAIALGMSSPFGVGGSAFRTGRGRAMLTDTVVFGAYTRAAIERAGLFDEELVRNQDDEYNYRLRKLGGKLLYSPDIHSRYYSRSTLGATWRQYFQYGFWKVRVLQKHPRQMRPRQFVPPGFVATLLGSFLLALFTSTGHFLVTLVVGSYVLTNLAASVWTAHQKGWRYLPLLPVVFATLHLSYGLGFLAGLVRFAHRWRDR